MRKRDLKESAEERVAVPLWPTAGRARNSSYEAARRQEIPAMRFGRRWLVPKAWLRRLAGDGEAR
jgi:hypothetical protein